MHGYPISDHPAIFFPPGSLVQKQQQICKSNVRNSILRLAVCPSKSVHEGHLHEGHLTGTHTCRAGAQKAQVSQFTTATDDFLFVLPCPSHTTLQP